MTTQTSAFANLEPRERRLLVGLAIVLGLLVFVFVPFLLVRRLHQREAEIQEINDLVATIQEQKEVVQKRRAAQAGTLARYAKPAPQLQRYLDELTAQNGLAAAETIDRPDLPHGKKFTERSTLVKLHKVNLLPFVKMMEAIAKSPHPIAVNKLSIKPRSGEPDQYEIELALSAYDRKDAPPAATPAPSGAPAATAAPDPDGDD